jgi:TolB protein
VVKADLARSGIFKLIDNGDALSDSSAINYADWQKRGANALAVGSVTRLADGRFDVRYRSRHRQATQLSALSIGAQPQPLRLTAHKIADDIYQKLTGIPGIFSTRIAYVTKSGSEYRLEVADADGEGTQVALRSNEPIISPSWSPDGTKVAYVSSR